MSKETPEEAIERIRKDKYGTFISKDADVKGQLVIDTANAAFSSGMVEGIQWMENKIPLIIQEYLETAFISNEKGYMEPKKWFDIYKKMIHEN
jgi:hypothetical protein